MHVVYMLAAAMVIPDMIFYIKVRYSLVPKETNVTLIPNITLIRINTLTKCSLINLGRINLQFGRE